MSALSFTFRLTLLHVEDDTVFSPIYFSFPWTLLPNPTTYYRPHPKPDLICGSLWVAFVPWFQLPLSAVLSWVWSPSMSGNSKITRLSELVTIWPIRSCFLIFITSHFPLGSYDGLQSRCCRNWASKSNKQ